MGRTNRRDDIRTARRVKALLAAKSAAEFETFLTASQSDAKPTESRDPNSGTRIDYAGAYVANRAVSRG